VLWHKEVGLVVLQAMQEGALVAQGSGEREMAHTWDQEMMRLHHEIEALKRENAALRGMLSDAIGLCDAALAQEDARKRLAELADAVPPSR
jgi:hypothetical protein